MDPREFPTKGNLIAAKNSLALAKQGYDQISFGWEFSWVHNLTTFSFPALLAGIYR